MKKLTNKAQQEMVGFVLIVILVSIIGLIFLTIFMTKTTSRPSAEMSNLLQAVMYYTTDCYSQNNEPKEVEDLVNECNTNSNKKCLDGRNVCEALETALTKALDESLRIGDLYKNKAYHLEIYYRGSMNRVSLNNITSIVKGNFANCSSEEGGTHTITIGTSGSGGIISADLVVCKGIGEVNPTREETYGGKNLKTGSSLT